MDDDLYDEFGNYIGPDIEDEDSEVEEEPERQEPQVDYGDEPQEDEVVVHDENFANQIVLHEDKKYYPSALEIYGPGVETLVQEEDTQPLTQPIIAPIKTALSFVQEKGLPETAFKKEFLVDLMKYPDLIRNVALVGHLHHGKTSFMDMLVSHSHEIFMDAEKPLRYTDVHLLERDRGLSIKSMPMSFVMQNLKHKSHLLNFIDTPGHVNFTDEMTAALRIADGAILLVDAVEGVMANTENIIKQLVNENIPFFLMVNKVDRLILELKLPPEDAYFKLKHTIEEVNSILFKISDIRLSPEKGNVLFGSTEMGWCFSLKSFAAKYCENSEESFDVDAFARRLWGDIFFDSEKRSFRKAPREGEPRLRTFSHFILEPLYKLYGQVLGEDPKELRETLASLGIVLKNSAYKLNMKPLLRLVFDQFFGNLNGLTDMCVNLIPSPVESAKTKIERMYSGDLKGKYGTAMTECDPEGPLMIQIVKLYNADNVLSFDAFGRILSGTLNKGQSVRVLGEGYSPDDEEDMAVHAVSNIAVYQSRYKINVESASAGNWVLLSGVDSTIIKTATITDTNEDEDDPVYIFKPLRFNTIPVLKVAVEPVNPTELPKMLEGLRKVNKSYQILSTKVEESGEHILLGTGELYLDCVMHDLRKLYAEIDIKIADPVVRFCETVVEVSQIKCYAETPNKKNKITMICEPLERGIAEDIENYKVNINSPPKVLAEHFVSKYEWDILAARNIWAFGPDENGPNMLINDTLPAETNKKLLFSIKDSIKQGFQWATREGPLTDERNSALT
ncbi:hypothetical protein HK103_002176 [Boothiomyces macroporosus]|uniref:Tr-type G domain-containing protein n=1 Tax=Boothiomyces macroporosus TaxID=261099 RepID=A0AAD5Y2P2_9FUNG|nr:hypothetical protein HK103_002176 [Boothiomyces macroporosus]